MKAMKFQMPKNSVQFLTTRLTAEIICNLFVEYVYIYAKKDTTVPEDEIIVFHEESLKAILGWMGLVKTEELLKVYKGLNSILEDHDLLNIYGEINDIKKLAIQMDYLCSMIRSYLKYNNPIKDTKFFYGKRNYDIRKALLFLYHNFQFRKFESKVLEQYCGKKTNDSTINNWLQKLAKEKYIIAEDPTSKPIIYRMTHLGRLAVKNHLEYGASTNPVPSVDETLKPLMHEEKTNNLPEILAEYNINGRIQQENFHNDEISTLTLKSEFKNNLEQGTLSNTTEIYRMGSVNNEKSSPVKAIEKLKLNTLQ